MMNDGGVVGWTSFSRIGKHRSCHDGLLSSDCSKTVVRVQQEIVKIRGRFCLSSFDITKPQSTSDTDSIWPAMEKTELRSLIDSFQR